MINVLFVCLGNICRSPLAEAIFTDLVNKRGLQNHIAADSCGTSNYHIGEDPDPRSIQSAQNQGVPISHKGRQLHKSDFEEFEYILPMDSSNLRNTLDKMKKSTDPISKVQLMREYDPEGKGEDVPDPYYGGEQGFENVFQMLHRSCEQLLDVIVKEHSLDT